MHATESADALLEEYLFGSADESVADTALQSGVFAQPELHALERELSYEFTDRWNVVRTPESDDQRVAKVRMIAGRSLKCTCMIPGHDNCKLHIDIKGRYHRAQGEILKWMASAPSTVIEHQASTEQVASEWKRYCAS